MNQHSSKIFRFQLPSVGSLLTLIVVIWLVWSIGLNGIINSFLILMGLSIIAPVLIWWGFRWWLSRNLIESQCPVCAYEFRAFNHTQSQCPNCGEPIQIENGQFQRLTPPGTIDVQAIDVSTKQIHD